MSWQKILFILLLIVCLFTSPPIALITGLIAALTFGNPFSERTKKAIRYLLQISVVLLGFGMNLTAVVKAGKDGILFTIASIFGTLILGFAVGRLLNINGKTSTLISSGTAICGGSAIAAVSPAINADAEETSVALGTIFILNSIALFVFPFVGHLLNLTENQFGIWAAIAIHDTSSVVGAAAKYGSEALAIATTVKLARALWIAPVSLFFSYLYRDKTSANKLKIKIPWFIFLFLLATIFRTYSPVYILPSIYDSLINLAKAGLTVTLFLIGATLSRETLKNVGFKPLLQGIILWLIISMVALWAVWKLV